MSADFLALANFGVDVLQTGDTSVNEVLLRQHTFKDLASVIYIDAVQVFCLYLFLCQYFTSIEQLELGHVVEDLQAVVLLILDGVEAEVHFSQQQQVANELQLRNLLNQIQRDVKEAQS